MQKLYTASGNVCPPPAVSASVKTVIAGLPRHRERAGWQGLLLSCSLRHNSLFREGCGRRGACLVAPGARAAAPTPACSWARARNPGDQSWECALPGCSAGGAGSWAAEFSCAHGCSVVFDSLRPHRLQPGGSSARGIFQTRMPECVAFPPPGAPPYPGLEPTSPVLPELQADSSPPSRWRSPSDLSLNSVISSHSSLITSLPATHRPREGQPSSNGAPSLEGPGGLKAQNLPPTLDSVTLPPWDPGGSISCHTLHLSF